MGTSVARGPEKVAGEEKVRQARWRRSTTTSSHFERVSKSSVSCEIGLKTVSDRGWRSRQSQLGLRCSSGSQRKSGDAIAACVAEARCKSLIHFSGPGIDFCKQKLAREMLD
jgi:hypothetical protein